jgi:metal-responsive CopG/Arc/MetJ family transcriptional regulator
MQDGADDLLACQHQPYRVGVAASHAPLDAVYGLEMLALRSMSGPIRCLAEHLIGIKGNMHGKLILTEARRDL